MQTYVNFQTAFAEFCNEPLAMLSSAIEQLRAKGPTHPDERQRRADAFLLRVRAAVGLEMPDAAAVTRRGDGVIMAGRTAIIPVFGVIDKRSGEYGDVSTDAIGASLDSLVADRQVRNIVGVFDTPGGSVAGVQELGEKWRAARDHKNTIAIASPMAASAGYWLAAQSAEVVAEPSAQVGSVGVISMHVDMGKALEQAGYKVTLITSSKYKGEGHPFGPLGEEATGDRQAKVNHYDAAFVEALAKGRSTTAHKVEKHFGEGRMLTPDAAKERGMIDRVATFEQVMHRLGAESAVQSRKIEAAKTAALIALEMANAGTY